MRRLALASSADPRLALRALVGVIALVGLGIVGRTQLDSVAPRLARREPAPVVVTQSLGITTAVETLIARVDVHPDRVCLGQDVVVEVALAPGHEASTVEIRGHHGTRAVMRFERRGPVDVPIVARDPHDGIQVRQLRLNVDECRALVYPRVVSR